MPAMLVVSDLRLSIDFYTRVVGLELVDRTASAFALQQQQVEAVEILVARNADVNRRTKDQLSPLHPAPDLDFLRIGTE